MGLKISYFNIFNNRCPRNCSEKGTCNEGVCQCNTGYLLRDCSVETKIFVESTPETEIVIRPGLNSYALIPVNQIFQESVLKITNFVAPLECYISSVSLTGETEEEDSRLLVRQLEISDTYDENNSDPPTKSKHDYKIMPDDSGFINLGGGQE